MRTYGKLRAYPYYLEHGGFESVQNSSEIAPERPKTAQHRPRTLEDSPGTPQETPGTLPRAPGTFTYVRTISFVGRELARRVLALESTCVYGSGFESFLLFAPPCNPRLRPIVPRLSSRPTPRPPRNEEAPSSTAPSRRGHGGSLAYPFEITAQNSLLSSPPLGEKGWFSDV